MTVPAALAEVVGQLRIAWEARDLAALVGLWDADHPAITYVAEEVPGALLGFEAIGEYWRGVFERFREIRVTLRPLAADVIGGYAWVLGLGGFQGVRLADGARVRTEGVRVGILLRDTGKGWKVLHYVEAPLRGGAGG